MFTETDEIFVWAKKGRKNKVYKLKTSASVKQLFIELFNNGINSLMQDDNGDEREPIPFENNYSVTAREENFIIRTFVIPQELRDAIDAPDVVENYTPIDEKGKTEEGYEIRAIVIGAKDEQGYYLAGQRFTQRQVMVKPKGFNLFFQHDMFVEERQRQEEAYKKELEDKNRELELAIKQEAKANRSKQEFLFNMSHDIRTPMNAIIGFTSLAQTHLDDKEMLDSYLKKISTSSEYLLSLINDVLDMSRIESGKLKIEESNVYLPSILDDIRDIVSSNISKKQLSLNINTVGLKDTHVLTDPLKLKQVLLNVVANAIKFTPSGGYVNLSLVQKDDSGNYDFIVEDNGIGISKEFQEHIFEQFSREATSTVSRVQGTGLGLSISKAIVDMMGGSISVESESGKGSKFTISLRFKITNEITIDNKNSINNIIDTNKKILLVEDNELNYEIAKTVLEEAGFIIDGASNGKEAVDKASDNTYDVILMDIQMPVMDGYEATKELRKLGNRTPIIAMTANAFSEDRKKAEDVGMDGYIAKPIDVNKLVSTIINILGDQ